VTVSAYLEAGKGVVAVESAGQPFELPAASGRTPSEGLGVAIVQWIALAHAGELRLAREGVRNTVALVLPVAAA
jgi:nitrogen-specific signal transduction histidine kinase